MEYFKNYSSNTLCGSGSQFVFESDVLPHTGRIYYRVTVGGEFNWSLLFSNVTDGTFNRGEVSHANMFLPPWEILGMRLAVSPIHEPGQEENFTAVTFDGQLSHRVAPGEFFTTDPVKLNVPDGYFLCVETTYRGRLLPNHEESTISAFLDSSNGWVPSKHMPYPGMVGCDRPVKKRVAFFGDSITQGCGTPVDGYAQWNAVMARNLPRDIAFWNVGLGYGRARDAASDGAWMFRAKRSDIVFVCFGVNDILRDATAAKVKDYLCQTVSILHANGCRVFIQTIPPFDYSPEVEKAWAEINEFIMSGGTGADEKFNCVPVLAARPGSSETKFGGHPNAEGSAIWAEAILPTARRFILGE